ncbi:sulfurtransferase [Polynucleobacter kasalickyi]|uniref:Thiosulfate/3-mercaptopyruvate sulfurtransferase n=1 Tax=Polynucleobacter kasalickyi TaxID=1938817 RepID=A0A1W2C877_9BURK|nr:rhodanese-like domain-containing protein [Polynucleobacter kasalickyi]SMC81321.1 thiosulfate/3-mercaptopyruvate sulfurtransferase [Polynucleobacter kasalickyi]
MFAQLKKFLPSILCTLFATHVLAQGLDTIIDAQQMQKAIERGAIIWDVRDEKSYLEGHIPGAMNLGDAGVVLRDMNKEDYLPTEQIKKIFDAAGLDIHREVMVYGTRGNPYSYFALHTINYFGGNQAKIYHDGIDGWKTAGLPTTKERTKLAPVSVALVEQTQLMVSNEEMLNLYNKGNLQIVDARTPDEYAGKDVRAIRGGHIPNAINIPFEENWQDPTTAIKLSKKQVAENSGMSLKNTLDLKKLYAKLDPNKETVVYCQSGVRASETTTILKNLGFKNVKVYDSSWLGWGNNLNAPAEQETFLNVGALNAKITAMQAKINQLEDALKAKSN